MGEGVACVANEFTPAGVGVGVVAKLFCAGPAPSEFPLYTLSALTLQYASDMSALETYDSHEPLPGQLSEKVPPAQSPQKVVSKTMLICLKCDWMSQPANFAAGWPQDFGFGFFPRASEGAAPPPQNQMLTSVPVHSEVCVLVIWFGCDGNQL